MDANLRGLRRSDDPVALIAEDIRRGVDIPKYQLLSFLGHKTSREATGIISPKNPVVWIPRFLEFATKKHAIWLAGYACEQYLYAKEVEWALKNKRRWVEIHDVGIKTRSDLTASIDTVVLEYKDIRFERCFKMQEIYEQNLDERQAVNLSIEEFIINLFNQELLPKTNEMPWLAIAEALGYPDEQQYGLLVFDDVIRNLLWSRTKDYKTYVTVCLAKINLELSGDIWLKKASMKLVERLIGDDRS